MAGAINDQMKPRSVLSQQLHTIHTLSHCQYDLSYPKEEEEHEQDELLYHRNGIGS